MSIWNESDSQTYREIADVVDDSARSVPNGGGGYMVIRMRDGRTAARLLARSSPKSSQADSLR